MLLAFWNWKIKKGLETSFLWFLWKWQELVGWFKARITDTQRELFFKNPQLLGLGRHFGMKFFKAVGVVFSAGLSAPILALWVPCPCFPLLNHYFSIKLSHHIQLPNIYLGVGFEFGLQRIWDFTFSRG